MGRFPTTVNAWITISEDFESKYLNSPQNKPQWDDEMQLNYLLILPVVGSQDEGTNCLPAFSLYPMATARPLIDRRAHV